MLLKLDLLQNYCKYDMYTLKLLETIEMLCKKVDKSTKIGFVVIL